MGNIRFLPVKRKTSAAEKASGIDLRPVVPAAHHNVAHRRQTGPGPTLFPMIPYLVDRQATRSLPPGVVVNFKVIRCLPESRRTSHQATKERPG